MTNIKPIKRSDILELIEIKKDVFDYSKTIEEFENHYNEDSIKVWKISTTKIVGFVSFYYIKDEVEIIQIGIKKPYRRKNYGSLLINKIKKLNNLKKIFIEVSVENSQAIKFYLKNGFKKIGIRKAYYKSNNKRINALRLLFEF